MQATGNASGLDKYGLITAVIWLVGFAIQQALQLVDPLVESGIARYKAHRLNRGSIALPNAMSEAEFKRSAMATLAFLAALGVTCFSNVRLLEFLSSNAGFALTARHGVPTLSSLFDGVVSALVLGAGTDGANTAIKYFGYVKDGRAAVAATELRRLAASGFGPAELDPSPQSTTIDVTANGPITVSYESALGQSGELLAVAISPRVAAAYRTLENWFGIQGGVVQVVIRSFSELSDGSGGGRHGGCDFHTGGLLEIDATFGSPTLDPVELATGISISELSECFMGPQSKGWDCGANTGEALSRVCARMLTDARTMSRWSTGPSWVNAGKPDYLTRVREDDTTTSAIGCVVLYIDWMMANGFSISQIVAAGGDVPRNYSQLTARKTSVFADFKNAVDALNGPIVNDTPFTSPLG